MKAVIALVDSNSRTEKRTPVTLKIKFKSETIEQFIERYAVDVSKGGIFVRTKEPLAVGTTMKFEFQLKDTTTLIAGEGTVVWTRENDATRPNVAPGMGVRFDKLAEGSQVVLDKILFEKSRGVAARTAETKPPSFSDSPMRAPERASERPVKVTDPGEFNDAPTRVGFIDAPTRVSMLGEMEANAGRAQRATMPGTVNNDFAGEREKTPLPGPMPFHSDADDFPEETFAEATKIRSLDELAASTLQNPLATAPEPINVPSASQRAGRPSVAPNLADADDAPALASPPEADVTAIPKVSFETGPKPKPETSDVSAERQKRPTDTSAGENRASAKALDTSPSPRTESKTKIDSQAPKTTPKVSVNMPAVAVAAPSPPAQASSGSRGAGVFIGGLAVAAAAAAGIWYFVIREQKAKISSPSTPVVAKPADPVVVAPPPVTGSGAGSQEAGSAAPVPVPVASAELATTIITARGDKTLQIEVVGTDQKGPSPLSAKLEKGKSFTVRAVAPGFKTTEITVTGGVAKANIDIVAKPRLLHIESTPTGANVFVDGVATGKTTPADIEIKSRGNTARITLRKPGFAQSQSVVAMTTFVEEGDAMKASISPTLVVAAAPRPRPPVDAPTPDATPADSKPMDPKPPTDAKPADPKPADAKPADTKPADTKPADTKPADAKPADAKPVTTGEPQPTWIK